MSDPQGKGAPGEEGNMQEATAGHMSSNTQQVPGAALVSSPVASLQPPATTATEDEDESEDESEILEESPCGRWQKRREEVGAYMWCVLWSCHETHHILGHHLCVKIRHS